MVPLSFSYSFGLDFAYIRTEAYRIPPYVYTIYPFNLFELIPVSQLEQTTLYVSG